MECEQKKVKDAPGVFDKENGVDISSGGKPGDRAGVTAGGDAEFHS